ncbi:basic proline-rich protein-like [Prorops nasuta]|uniref:basic proline-rich protein-like n=1 Tax=Prorops nasuta TaxID=863751 RepID=UPI0034CE8B4D
MKANGTNNGCSRLNTPLAATTTLEDPGTPASWKGPPPGSEASPFTPNSVGQGGGPQSGPYNNTGGPPSNAGFQGPGSFPGSAGSPAGAPPYQGPPPGSATPQYTASPAPSGSSTPGPGPPPNSTGFPPPPNSTGPPYNGPGPSPFGSPSGGPPQFVGRPGSSGPPFVGPPGGGNPHFPSPGQPFGGPQYGMPPGSPFGPGGHPMAGPMGPGHPMMGPAGAVERMDQARLCINFHGGPLLELLPFFALDFQGLPRNHLVLYKDLLSCSNTVCKVYSNKFPTARWDLKFNHLDTPMIID